MRRHKKQSKLPLGITLLSLIAIAGGFVVYKNVTSNKKKEIIAPQNLPTAVNVIQIKLGEASTMQEWSAKISPYKFAEIRPQVEGVIVSRLFREGSYVKQGQPLYKIDPVEKIIIKAPISGYIGRSSLTDGALVTKNQVQPLAVITQMEQMYADIIIPSNMVEQIKSNKNAKVELTLTTETGVESYPYEGKIQFADVTVDQSTDSVIVRALFPNPEEKLLSGASVLAKINLPQENIITVPQRATERSPNGELSVWILNQDNTIRKQVVISERAIGSDWIISSGVIDGDVIIYEGFQKINPQSVVEPTLVSRFTGEKIDAPIHQQETQVEEEAAGGQAIDVKQVEPVATKEVVQSDDSTPIIKGQLKGEQYIDPATAVVVAQKMAEARDSKPQEVEKKSQAASSKKSSASKNKAKSKASKHKAKTKKQSKKNSKKKKNSKGGGKSDRK